MLKKEEIIEKKKAIEAIETLKARISELNTELFSTTEEVIKKAKKATNKDVKELKKICKVKLKGKIKIEAKYDLDFDLPYYNNDDELEGYGDVQCLFPEGYSSLNYLICDKYIQNIPRKNIKNICPEIKNIIKKRDYLFKKIDKTVKEICKEMNYYIEDHKEILYQILEG